MSTAPRSFLLLQGNATRFFRALGLALMQRGHEVHRILFNGGDRLFWRLPGAVSFRGDIEDWPLFLDEHLERRPASDVVLFGDGRPIHQAALPVLRRRGIRPWVLEEGYFRPNWVTLERDGSNGFSRLPRAIDAYLHQAERLPERPDPELPATRFARRATEDVAYHIARVALHPAYRRHRLHGATSPFIEYAGYLRGFLREKTERQRALALLPRFLGQSFYLVPLQLDADYQLRLHSRFGAMSMALAEIIDSFARYASKDSLLVVKRHPLDPGLKDWRRVVAELAAAQGVAARVLYLCHDDLRGLLSHSRGVVTVNSTVGTLALGMGLPVVTLGHAVYDLDGLTFRHGLDRFWREATPPDPAAFRAFRRVLVNTCLIPGNFFSDEGIRSAVAVAIERLEAALPEPLYRPLPALPWGAALPQASAV